MIKPVKLLLKILRGNITINNQKVNVIKRGYPLDKTPCITIDDSGGSTTLNKDLIKYYTTLPPTHPQYNPSEPNKKHPQQAIKTKRNTTLTVNVWCDNEDDRENILKQIETLFNHAYSDHYRFCKQHDEGQCTYLDKECPAITDTFKRGIKNQCPKPKEYHYKNLFSQFDIKKSSFNFESPFSIDDGSTKPKTLHSVIRVTMTYYDYHIIGGNITQDVEYHEE